MSERRRRLLLIPQVGVRGRDGEGVNVVRQTCGGLQ